jgi:hypothetical protein
VTKILIYLLVLLAAAAGLAAVIVRHEGFLPYPAAPISILILQDTMIQGKGDRPGSASGPPPSSSVYTESLQGFDAANTRKSGCFEDDVIPLGDGQNMRVMKCAAAQTDVPFFGPGAPSNDDRIWLLYWLTPLDSKPNGDTRPLAHSAYASYGACWLALQRLDKKNDAIFSENVERAISAHTAPPVYDSTPSYCKALKNEPPPKKP